MDITISPGLLKGSLPAIASKSHAHRLLICAAFADGPTKILCNTKNEDMDATVRCLNALGAQISGFPWGYAVVPAVTVPEFATLDCGESGSTLRFLLPVAASLGVTADFVLSGRLPQRPLSPLWEELEAKGYRLSRASANVIRGCGKLSADHFAILGNVSSQYITGLLFAMTLLPHPSRLTVLGKLESEPYVQITLQALEQFGVRFHDYCLDSPQALHSPGTVAVEGDWSNAAFFLAANRLGSDIHLSGLNLQSKQGDRRIQDLLSRLEQNCVIDCAHIPDLVPVLAVTAAAMQGASFTNVRRLRAKESDRLETTCAMLRAFGAKAVCGENDLQVFPSPLQGCVIDGAGDHRIAMAAAIGATAANGPVTVTGANCVQKSYPAFWEDYRQLGGQYVQLLR